MSAAHHRTKPAVGRAKLRGKKVVVVQVCAVVVAHGSPAVGVEESNYSRVVRSGVDETVQLRRQLPKKIVQSPVDMTLVPGWTGVLGALRSEFKRADLRTLRINGAVIRRRECRIASRIRRSRAMERGYTRFGIELR